MEDTLIPIFGILWLVLLTLAPFALVGYKFLVDQRTRQKKLDTLRDLVERGTDAEQLERVAASLTDELSEKDDSREYPAYLTWGIITGVGGLGFLTMSAIYYFDLFQLEQSMQLALGMFTPGLVLAFLSVALLLVHKYSWLPAQEDEEADGGESGEDGSELVQARTEQAAGK